MNELNNAKYIKALFVDYLTERQFENYIIGSEILFADKNALADLVLLSNMVSTAFEIKAQNDDFRRIEYQFSDYNKVFDFVNLIITEKHFQKAKRIMSANNGIIIITNNQKIEVYKKPKQNKKLSKEKIAATMTISFLKKYFNIRQNNYNGLEIRNILQKKDIKELSNAMYIFLYSRIKNKYVNFMHEKGKKTHFEDISLLSLPNKKIIL